MTEFAFFASTGRTATTRIATTLNTLPEVLALHEGQFPDKKREVRLPLINIQNRKAWYEQSYASELVRQRRNRQILMNATGSYHLLIDVAYYNAAILEALISHYPDAAKIIVFRRCESFVQSATIINGEDKQPAGWPDTRKTLTDRERYISLGRLKPSKGSPESDSWKNWSAIQRNIWLWSYINSHLWHLSQTSPNCYVVFYEDLCARAEHFWHEILAALNQLNRNNLRLCMSLTTKAINQRSAYQVGARDSWQDFEVSLYKRLAQPLEETIYG